jgi:hypothetical protein
MIHLEHDYQGSDYSVNSKALNPSPTDFGGMYFASYLQSVTKNLAVGFESLHQRASGMTDTSTSYLAKYTGSDKGLDCNCPAPTIGCASSDLLAETGREGGGCCGFTSCERSTEERRGGHPWVEIRPADVDFPCPVGFDWQGFGIT